MRAVQRQAQGVVGMADTTELAWYADAELFADLDDDREPFAVNPSADLTADATPLDNTENHLIGAILKFVHRVAGGKRDDLEPMVSLAVEETYARLGYPHLAAQIDELRPDAGPSHEELRELPDPTPEDFRETLLDIIEAPEEYVRKRQITERTSRDARQLQRLLPKADQWDLPGETQNSEAMPANESAVSDIDI
jgi:hypothetical protein